jgi:asparagine N-glycosylation enzyme membrane subunit Stt3
MTLLDKSSKVDIKLALLLAIWYVGMIYASFKGIRFIMLLVPAFSVAIGIAIGYIYQYILEINKNHLKIGELWAKIGVFLILCLVLISPIQMGIATGDNFVPSITTGWWNALTKIREESKPNAIINSWWDFGHWFKYVADRAVTLDGASQNSPVAHWLGAVLQTSNEKEAVATLRMLDCGSNTFFDKINEKYNDTEKSQNIVSNAILMNTANATEYLQSLGFTNIQNILKYSHCTPPEDYFITSEDMVGKAGVWAHFGLWNFDKAFIINDVRPKPLAEGVKLLEERFNYTVDEATRIYYEVQALQTDSEMNNWIAPWPSYAGGTIGCQNVSDTAVCNVNMAIGNNGQTTTVIDRAIVNLTKPENSQLILAFYDQTGKKLQETAGTFSELTIIDNTTRKYESDNASISLGMLLSINRDGDQPTYTALISDPLLTDSVFTRLFFLDGQNMKYFDKFYDTTDITGQRIIVWKVNWDKFLDENG